MCNGQNFIHMSVYKQWNWLVMFYFLTECPLWCECWDEFWHWYGKKLSGQKQANHCVCWNKQNICKFPCPFFFHILVGPGIKFSALLQKFSVLLSLYFDQLAKYIRGRFFLYHLICIPFQQRNFYLNHFNWRIIPNFLSWNYIYDIVDTEILKLFNQSKQALCCQSNIYF